MFAQLVARGVMEATNSGVLEGSVHPLNLAVGSGMKRSGQAVLNAMLETYDVEQVKLI